MSNMPAWLRVRPSQYGTTFIWRHAFCTSQRFHALTVERPAFDDAYQNDIIPEIAVRRHDPSQPPSHRRAEVRKTQLLRQYISLLRSSPIVLLFQHNSLLATEFTAIRTLLKASLRKLDQAQGSHYADDIKLQVMRTGLLDTAIRLVDFWPPRNRALNALPEDENTTETTHSLSEEAFQALAENDQSHGLEALLSGPIAILSLPWMSPEHLKVVLSILAPSPEFPAPKRRSLPAYYEPSVQNGIAKLMLLGARIEGSSMDNARTRWVGGVSGGVDSLRGHLVTLLQGVGAGLISAMGAPGQSIAQTLDSRHKSLTTESKLLPQDV